MLLIHAKRDAHSRYSRYLAEILRLEGFANFAETDIEALDDRLLGGAGLVLLPRILMQSAETDRLVDYVAQGGTLIAFMPDAHLSARLGLAPTYRSTAAGAGYLWIDAAEPTTTGLCPEPVQVLTPAAIWRPSPSSSLTVVADVRDADNPPVRAPGVVRVALGRGEAVAFSYDLPQTIARLRQGDPAYADVPSSGVDHYFRPHELFVHQLPPRQQHLPQADVQTALLARLIESIAPQPRIWYYPEARERSVMVMTSDDDWSTIDQFEALLAALRQRDATCSFYIVPGTHVSPPLMGAWEAFGHTFSVHPALASDYGAASTDAAPQATFVGDMIRQNVERHRRELDRPVRTIRQHAVRWSGYLAPARVLADLGVRMECNYVSVAPLTIGHLAGSGRPLRFVDTDGSLVDCYQQPTTWTEECLVHPAHPAGAHWHVDHAIVETEANIRRAARAFYTPITINSHPVSFATYSRPLIEANWDTARAEGMRILSADRWLDWTEVRQQVAVAPDGDGWTVHSPVAAAAVTLLFPQGSAPEADASDGTTQALWGRTYDALTLRNLAEGERRRVRRASPVESGQPRTSR